MKHTKNTKSFASRWGFILASVGSAVGMANVWGFPNKLGSNGGGAFLLICRTIKLNAGAHGGHRRCCHAQMQKNAQNKPQIARLILCVHTTLQVYCNLFLTFCY